MSSSGSIDNTLDNILMQNRLLTEEIRRRVDQLAAINSVATMVSQSLDLNKTLNSALDSVLQVIPVSAAGISLIDEDAGELILRAQRGWKHDFVSTPMRIKLGEGLSGEVLKQDAVVVTGNVAEDPRIIVSAFTTEEPVQAMAMAPMHAQGRIVGIVSVMHYEPYEFTTEQTDVLGAIADQLGVALENARLYENVVAKQSRLSAIIDSTADAIIAVDTSGRITLVNDAAEDMFNLRSEQLLGQALSNAFENTQLRERVQRILDESPRENSFFEIMLAEERSLLVTVSRVASEDQFGDGEDSGWMVVMQDTTHLRDAERNRVRFIQTAAHDLKNPLGVALSGLVYLKDTVPQKVTEDEQELLDLSIASIEQIQRLIDDLLNLERIQSGLGLNSDEIDVPDIVERAMLEVKLPIQHKRQVFNWELEDNLPTLYGDKRWLSRAIVNLLSNANKYTPEGGEIKLSVRHEQGEIIIAVSDTGVGISPANQKRVFDNFFREPRIRERSPGTGLGLAIVKSVVEQHNGRVYLNSAENAGTTVEMALPITPENAPE